MQKYNLKLKSFILAACIAFSILWVNSANEAIAAQAEPIKGGWFNLRNYGSQQDYMTPMKKAVDAGMEYIVIQLVTTWDGTAVYYYSDIFPRLSGLQMDQLEALLSAADYYNLKVFVGNGFFNANEAWSLTDNLKAMEEISAKYSHHQSFYGWYWSAEAVIYPTYGFSSGYISNSKASSDKARQLTPNAKILIAPYGTNRVTDSNIMDLLISQLPELGVDIIAYQDEVGVRKSTTDETKVYFSNLRQVHDSVPQVALWADVEIFEFEGAVYTGTYVCPTSDFARVVRQLESVLPVDVALAYDLNGMLGSSASSTAFYDNYISWLGSIEQDTAAPSAPSNIIAAAVSSSRIDLSWTASTDNVGVTGYRVERCSGSTCTNFVQIGTPADITFSNTGLTSSTTYRYRVRAADAAGNLSGYSSIASATTPTGTGGTGPVAWWKFDETSGEAASDSSGNANTGTLVNGPNWTAGKINNALGFDGVDDYMTISSGIINAAGTATFTFWAKNNGDMTGYGPSVLSPSTDGIFNIYPDMDERIKLSLGWKSWVFDDTFHAKVPIGTWAHYAVVIDTSTLYLYLNGTQIWSSARTSNASNPSTWRIGSRQEGAVGYYKGVVDDVRIYNRALSPEEIQAIYKSEFHKSDSDCNGCVSGTELSDFINLWYLDSSNPTLKELMEAIGFWKRGCS